MRLGDTVRLISINGNFNPQKVRDTEDYWKLIGETGTVVQDPTQCSSYADFSKRKKVLVRFDKNLKDKNLIAHNNVENSLWFLETDLVTVEK